VAFLMLQNGFSKANPILGGLDAWIEAGYPLEP
jgi:rhodanese-related sulfurtransferase